MSLLQIDRQGPVVTLTLDRPPVNALNLELVNALHSRLRELEQDPGVGAVVLTGAGRFFSFGFDVPALYPLNRVAFTGFLTRFSELYRYLFIYPKPLVAALNGHAPAGGCILALGCDRRLIVPKARLGLNEIELGAALPGASAEMLRYWVGSRQAERLALDGNLVEAEAARQMGLVDAIHEPAELPEAARQLATTLAGRPGPAYGADKRLLRGPIMEAAGAREGASLALFVELWYGGIARQRLGQVTIR